MSSMIPVVNDIKIADRIVLSNDSSDLSVLVRKPTSFNQLNEFAHSIFKIEQHVQLSFYLQYTTNNNTKTIDAALLDDDAVSLIQSGDIIKVKVNDAVDKSSENHIPVPAIKTLVEVFVTTLGGNIHIIEDVDLSTTVAFFKERLQTITFIPFDQMRLLFGGITGQQLNDHYSLQDYNIENHSVIHLLLNLACT
jgi:hypothetical protein